MCKRHPDENLLTQVAGTKELLLFPPCVTATCNRQVAGTKELLLFPPSDARHLAYTARPKGRLRYEWPARFSREPIDAETAGRRVVFASSVNLAAPDLARHPGLARATPYRCTLRAGETLLLPAFWHHEVHSHPAEPDPAGGTGVNVAINFWFRNESAPPEGC